MGKLARDFKVVLERTTAALEHVNRFAEREIADLNQMYADRGSSAGILRPEEYPDQAQFNLAVQLARETRQINRQAEYNTQFWDALKRGLQQSSDERAEEVKQYRELNRREPPRVYTTSPVDGPAQRIGISSDAIKAMGVHFLDYARLNIVEPDIVEPLNPTNPQSFNKKADVYPSEPDVPTFGSSKRDAPDAPVKPPEPEPELPRVYRVRETAPPSARTGRLVSTARAEPVSLPPPERTEMGGPAPVEPPTYAAYQYNPLTGRWDRLVEQPFAANDMAGQGGPQLPPRLDQPMPKELAAEEETPAPAAPAESPAPSPPRRKRRPLVAATYRPEPARDLRAKGRYTRGDLYEAGLTNQRLNENLNADYEALEKAYDRLLDIGAEKGMDLPGNPFRANQSGRERSWLGAYTPRIRSVDPATGRLESKEAFRANRVRDMVGGTLLEMHRFNEAWRREAERTGVDLRAAEIDVVIEAARRLRVEARQDYERIRAARGEGFFSVDTLVDVAAGVVGYFNDPVQIGTIGVGAEATLAKTIAGAAVREFAINAGVEAALQPGIQTSKLDAGVIETWHQAIEDGLANVTLAGAIGGIFGGAGKAIDRYVFEPGRAPPEGEAPAPEAGPARSPEETMDRARFSLEALATKVAEEDPEAAAVVREALARAEIEFATARAKPDAVADDDFVVAIEAAERKLADITALLERPDPEPPGRPRSPDVPTDDTPAPKLGETFEVEGRPVRFETVNILELGVSPREFQYKRYRGEEGVNDALDDVNKWDRVSSGKGMIFERRNGAQDVVDGHQRRNRARIIAGQTGETYIPLDAYIYREADGWTPADLRRLAALKNIREGRSDVLDTAAFLRESPDAIDGSIPVSRAQIRQARQIARLAPEAYDLVRAGVLDANYGALIGQVAPDRPGVHGPLARTLVEARPENIRQAEAIVSEAMQDFTTRDVAPDQLGLFGSDDLSRSAMYLERAQIMDAAYQALRANFSVFTTLVNRGDIARAVGNELVDAANLTAKDQMELAIAAIVHSRKSGVRTAITDMVTEAIDKVRREGVSTRAAGQEVARRITALVEERGFRALIEPGGERPPAPADLPLFDGAGSPAHVAQADALEAELRSEGREPPKVDLAKEAEEAAKEAQEARKKAIEAETAEREKRIKADQEALKARWVEGPDKPAFDRIEQAYLKAPHFLGGELVWMADLRPLLGDMSKAEQNAAIGEMYQKRLVYLTSSEDQGALTQAQWDAAYKPFGIGKQGATLISVDRSAMASYRKVRAEAAKETAPDEMTGGAEPPPDPATVIRAKLAGLTDEHKLALVREQFPDAYPSLNRLTGEDLTEAIVGVATRGVKSSVADALPVAPATREALIVRIDQEFGANAGALIRMGEVNIGNRPPAGYHPSTVALADPQGRVTIFAANADPEMVRGIILHEIGAHTGLGEVLGVDGYIDLMRRVEERMRRAAPDHPIWQGIGTSAPDDPIAALASRKQSEWDAAVAKGLPMDQASRMERARAMGFDTDRVLYHGTQNDIDEFIPSVGGASGSGVYLTTDPNKASGYSMASRAGEGSSNVLPVYVRGKIAEASDTVPWEDLPAETAEYYRRRNFDFVTYEALLLDDKQKPEGLAGIFQGTTLVVFDPSNIRSVNAAFDPDNADSAKLLASRNTETAPARDSIVTAMNRVPADTPEIYRVNETYAYLVQYAPEDRFVRNLRADLRVWLYREMPFLRGALVVTDADLRSLALGVVRSRIRRANRPIAYRRMSKGGITSEAEVQRFPEFDDTPAPDWRKQVPAENVERAKKAGFDTDQAWVHYSSEPVVEVLETSGDLGLHVMRADASTSRLLTRRRSHQILFTKGRFAKAPDLGEWGSRNKYLSKRNDPYFADEWDPKYKSLWDDLDQLAKSINYQERNPDWDDVYDPHGVYIWRPGVRDLLKKHGISGFEYSNNIEAQGGVSRVIIDPAAVREAVGDRFTFGGSRAETADLKAKARAESELARGMSQEEVHKLTGWFKGHDGKWRFELDDSGAKLKGYAKRLKIPGIGGHTPLGKGWDGNTFVASPKNADQAGDWAIEQSFNGELGDVLQHDKLFAAYPWLAKVETEVGIGEYYGTQGETGNFRLVAYGEKPEDALSVLLHEIQHAIQAYEVFANGGNAETMIDRNLQYILTLREEAETAGHNRKPVLNEMINRLEAANSTLLTGGGMFGPGEAGMLSYQALIGEEEARRVQSRQSMSAGQRRRSFPLSGSDIPPEQPLLDATLPMWVEFDPGVVATVTKIVDEVNAERAAYGDENDIINLWGVLSEITNRTPRELAEMHRSNYESRPDMARAIVEQRLRAAMVFERIEEAGIEKQTPGFRQLDLSEVLDTAQIEKDRITLVGVDTPDATRAETEKRAFEISLDRLTREKNIEERAFKNVTGFEDQIAFDRALLKALSDHLGIEPDYSITDTWFNFSERQITNIALVRMVRNVPRAISEPIYRKSLSSSSYYSSSKETIIAIEALKAADALPPTLQKAVDDFPAFLETYADVTLASGQLEKFLNDSPSGFTSTGGPASISSTSGRGRVIKADAENQTEAGPRGLRTGADAAGRDDAGAVGGAGVSAAGSGPGRGLARSKKPLAGDAVSANPRDRFPAPPIRNRGPDFDQKPWALTADQRKSRLQQFFEWVKATNIVVHQRGFTTDWALRDGARSVMPKDKVMRVTTRRYTVQITDDMHPTWKAELDSSKTHLDVEIHGREAAVTNSHVSHGLRSTGLGEKLYRSMLDHLLSEDVRVINSDISMSINSIRLWRSLERKGYRLVQRVPDEEMELDPGSGQYHDATGKNRSLFAVVGKQERQPDLPQTREEVLREADEARNLGEHMAACTKGKR
jgi:hypothetical protein